MIAITVIFLQLRKHLTRQRIQKVILSVENYPFAKVWGYKADTETIKPNAKKQGKLMSHSSLRFPTPWTVKFYPITLQITLVNWFWLRTRRIALVSFLDLRQVRIINIGSKKQVFSHNDSPALAFPLAYPSPPSLSHPPFLPLPSHRQSPIFVWIPQIEDESL